MRCLVTGATGHIGNVLVFDLYQHHYQIKIFCLPNDDVSIFDDLSIEITYGDITDYASVAHAMKDVDIIFHLAGMIDIGSGNRKKMHQVNVGGTDNILRACRENHNMPLLYVSSVHAIPERPKGQTIIETQVFDPNDVTGTYAKTKAEASMHVMEHIHSGGRAIIVHPSGVIGPYEYKPSNMGQMIHECAKGTLRVYINGAYNFVDVRDVAQGIRLAVEHGDFGQTYILSGEIIHVKQIFDIITQTCNLKPVKHRMPIWLARMTAFFAEYYYKIQKKKPLFTSYSIYTLQTNSDYSNQKAKTELGFHTRSIKESIIDTIDWLNTYQESK